MNYWKKIRFSEKANKDDLAKAKIRLFFFFGQVQTVLFFINSTYIFDTDR